MSGTQLNSDDVIANRLDEIKHLHSYDVYEKVRIEQCWDSTGRAPVKIKWVDVTKGIGYKEGDWQSGMKIDFIYISRAFFQAEAIREVYFELPAEDSEPGMCGRLKKFMYRTRDAAQNWGYAYIQFLRDEGFL